MISRILDVTADFNANNGVKLCLSEWETATFQFVTPTGTVSITGSNDGNEITGSTNPNALASINYTAIQATNLATGTAVTSVSASGLYKITVPCQYIQFGGASAAATKVLVFLNRPY
jgi:hypothetical protein